MIQNKYIIRLSFVGLFLNIIANMVLYRYFMIEEIIVKQVNEQNYKVAKIYQSHVWDLNKQGTEKLKHNNYRDLLQDKDFIKLAKTSMNFFENLGSQITIYDKSGHKMLSNSKFIIESLKYYDQDNLYNRIFAEVDQYFLKNLVIQDSLANSYEGKSTYTLTPKSIVSYEMGSSQNASFINTYIPIISHEYDGFKVSAVVEINTDITQQWQNISYLEKRIFIIFVIIFTIFFMMVMYNTSYAQKVINKQFETNRVLEEAKIKAESESSAKTEFLANVSHELRTPLNSIIGFSEIMVSETYGQIEDKQYREYVQDINNSGKHLLSVINDILDFSKASADKLKVEHIELNLNKLVSSSMRFLKPRANEAKVALIEDLPDEHIIITADPKRLKQALLNLLSNAVKFTPQHGSITMLIEKDKSAKLVRIKVVDTGIGMNEKDLPKALATFGQVDNSLSRRYEGTGLGLPLTKKLVELMQGNFDIQSQVGVGTSVTLTFKYNEEFKV
ncbi:MAG: sensor histidine kinase [Rickettsiaceae bacterium]|nr:MAG: sensor histidine kinase [Rickettsiaceae bacterium]